MSRNSSRRRKKPSKRLKILDTGRAELSPSVVAIDKATAFANNYALKFVASSVIGKVTMDLISGSLPVSSLVMVGGTFASACIGTVASHTLVGVSDAVKKSSDAGQFAPIALSIVGGAFMSQSFNYDPWLGAGVCYLTCGVQSAIDLFRCPDKRASVAHRKIKKQQVPAHIDGNAAKRRGVSKIDTDMIVPTGKVSLLPASNSRIKIAAENGRKKLTIAVFYLKNIHDESYSETAKEGVVIPLFASAFMSTLVVGGTAVAKYFFKGGGGVASSLAASAIGLAADITKNFMGRHLSQTTGVNIEKIVETRANSLVGKLFGKKKLASPAVGAESASPARQKKRLIPTENKGSRSSSNLKHKRDLG